VTRVAKEVKKLLNQDVNIDQRSLRMIQMPFTLPLIVSHFNQVTYKEVLHNLAKLPSNCLKFLRLC